MISSPSIIRQSLRSVSKTDRVALFTLLLLLGIALFSRSQALASLLFTIRSLIAISPFLIASIIFAAYIHATSADQLMAKVFSGNVIIIVLLASLFGAFSPLCSCGVIPVVAALLAAGMPLSGIMAFWLASPLMDPEMFILTTGQISFEFALARTYSAVGMGLFAGYLTALLQRTGILTDPAKKLVLACSISLADKQPIWNFWLEQERRKAFLASARDIGFFLLKWMTFAFVLESLLLTYIPTELVGQWLGGSSNLAIPLAVLIGVPSYLNGYAAIPTVAGLLELGMSQGAALAFMTAGGVTSIPAILSVYPLVKRPAFLLYLTIALTGALCTGFIYAAW